MTVYLTSEVLLVMYTFIVQCKFCGEPIDFDPTVDNAHTFIDRYGNNTCRSVYPEYRDGINVLPAHQPGD